jgi:hypothetical protein
LSGVKFGGAIAVEQPQQGAGDGSEIVAALGGAQQQDLACRRRGSEAVGAAMLTRCALFFDKGLQADGILDLNALVVAAAIAGEDLGASTMRTVYQRAR